MKDNFPKPYVNDTKMDSSLIQYVPMDHQEIGSRKSNMKMSLKGSNMGIDHVSNRKGS